MTDQELFDAFVQYQSTRSFSENTIRRRTVTLRSFTRHMTPVSVTTATLDDIEDWLSKLSSPTTRHAYLSDLRCFFRWAVRRHLVEADSTIEVDPIRTRKGLPKPAPVEAIERAFLVANADTQLMLMLGALAGLRRAEIAVLNSDDVYLDVVPPVLMVKEGKGNKDRIVPLHPMLVMMLRGRTGWIFPAAHGRSHMHPDRVGKALARALSANGVRVTGHQLRHYFGTETARHSNGNLLLVGKLMGHEDMNTTQGYTAFAPTEGAEVIAKLTAGRAIDDLSARRAQREAAG